jgi:hypothetical protein
MYKLSSILSKEMVKTNNSPPSFLSTIATRRIVKQSEDYMLLGDLFVSTKDNSIADIASNYDINVIRVFAASDIKRDSFENSLFFNGVDASINIKNKVELSIEDFTIDWWECPKALPKSNIDFIPDVQYTMYKNSSDIKRPFKIINDGVKKHICISSEGAMWDIAKDKYMGKALKDRWTHWAIVRCNNIFYTFRNGVLKNMWESDKSINAIDTNFTIGSGPKKDNFYGYMNKVRFTKGQALWTEEFNVKDDLFY